VRRIISVLTVAALMAAMMVIAGPAKADVFVSNGGFDSDGGDFDSSLTFVSIDSTFDTFSFSDDVFGFDIDPGGDVELGGDGSVIIV
jgi:hypothetical protein